MTWWRSRQLGTALRDYQLGGGYTPGPLYAACLVAGLLGSLCGLARIAGAVRYAATDTELAAGCLLVTLSAAVLLLSSDAYEFSWRYQLPAVVMLPVAGALGLTALARLTRMGNSSHDRPSKHSRRRSRASQVA